jgi:DNA-binding transcriptional LysR family regulator
MANHGGADVCNITLQQIETFLAVAEHMSFSEAARAMFISQPALSKSVFRLEENLNAKLFVRLRRGVQLTEAGRRFYTELYPLQTRIRRITEGIGDPRRVSNVILRVGCHFAYAEEGIFTDFKSLIHKFERDNPGVSALFMLDEYPALNDMLISGDADIIISTSFSVPQSPHISTRAVRKLEFYIAMSINNPLADGDALNAERLKDEVFYAISPGGVKHGASESEVFKHLGFTPANVQHLPNFVSVNMAVRGGRGFMLTGRFDTDRYTSGLRFFPPPVTQIPQRVVIAWRTNDVCAQARELAEILSNGAGGGYADI